jgi:metal-responsive CopG/Arc/MetJ family transcriptional regulator
MQSSQGDFVKKKISITLSTDLLLTIDRLIGSESSRSAFIEKVLRNHLRELECQAIHQRDFELINANADYLNREAEDVLRYQAEVDFSDLDRETFDLLIKVPISDEDLEP